MDKRKTWEQVDEIIKVLKTGCCYLDFPEDTEITKYMVEDRPRGEEKQDIATSPISPSGMYRGNFQVDGAGHDGLLTVVHTNADDSSSNVDGNALENIEENGREEEEGSQKSDAKEQAEPSEGAGARDPLLDQQKLGDVENVDAKSD